MTRTRASIDRGLDKLSALTVDNQRVRRASFSVGASLGALAAWFMWHRMKVHARRRRLDAALLAHLELDRPPIVRTRRPRQTLPERDWL